MPGNENGLIVVRKVLGIGTGDVLLQTTDGRWWRKWKGNIRTGEDVCTYYEKESKLK